jgi:threonine/homoserine/homoserine lactone efflux protein
VILSILAASLPLLLFIFAGLFSPAPNVVMLTTSGARFGFRATLPHLLGVPIGTGLLAAASVLGVQSILFALPAIEFTIKLISALWILWLSWKLINASRAKAQNTDRPFTFFQAILFQVVNPKVWAVALAASAGFSSDLNIWAEAARLFLGFSLINLFVCLFWTSAGHLLASYLQHPVIWRTFMTTMAAMMASSAALIFI